MKIFAPATQQILALLAQTPDVLTASDLFDRCEGVPNMQTVFAACNALKAEGKIVASETNEIGGNGRRRLGYQLVDRSPAALQAVPKPVAPVVVPDRFTFPPKPVNASNAPNASNASEPDDNIDERLDAFLADPPRYEPPPPAGFDASISLDGTLTISDGDASIELTSAQCARLFKFLEVHA